MEQPHTGQVIFTTIYRSLGTITKALFYEHIQFNISRHELLFN